MRVETRICPRLRTVPPETAVRHCSIGESSTSLGFLLIFLRASPTRLGSAPGEIWRAQVHISPTAMTGCLWLVFWGILVWVILGSSRRFGYDSGNEGAASARASVPGAMSDPRFRQEDRRCQESA